MSTGRAPMLSDYQIARMVTATYGYAGYPSVKWDWSDDGAGAIGVRWFVRQVDGVAYVCFPGTETARDLLRDLNTLPEETEIGNVHPGFYEGMAETINTILGHIGRTPVVVAGHSMGAARATLFTALTVKHGVKPLRRVVFGEPLSCFAEGAGLARQVPAASYRAVSRGEHDPICYLPPAIGFERATPLRNLTVAVTPQAIADLGPMLALHYMPDYAAALA